MGIRSINPASGELIAKFETFSESQLQAALQRSVSAFSVQRGRSFLSRSERLTKLASLLDTNQERLGCLLTEEMGKTVASARAEIKKCAWVCRYYAEHSEVFLADVSIESDASRSFIAHLPLGPVLAVMPWNFPFWQVFRFAAPALMAGNTVLLKHASNVPRCALELERLFSEAGFDAGAFQTLLTDADGVKRLLEDNRVQAASVTGSVAAGTAVAAVAGSCVKKTVLELGGSDAFIVMPSADLDAALDAAVTARTLNNGQSCIAAKRFIVHRDIHDAFLDRFVERFSQLRVGDPMDENTEIGPLAMEKTRSKLAEQVESLVAAGAQRECGAAAMERPGFFYAPGVLSHVPADSPCARQELFGPVALVFRADSFDAAIALANDNPYGLGSSVWTTQEEEIERAARHIDAGATFVNAVVQSDPRLPFGGIKASGYGRELSQLGILEFVNQKTVSIA